MRKRRAFCLILSTVGLLCIFAAHCLPGVCGGYRQRVYPWLHRLLLVVPAGFAWAAVCLLIVYVFHARRMLARRLWIAFVCLLDVLCVLWVPLYGDGAVAAPQTVQTLHEKCSFLIGELNGADLSGLRLEDAPLWRGAAVLGCGQTFGMTLRAPSLIEGCRPLDRLGIAGLYWPYTAHTLINLDDMPVFIPFTLCHELAHQAGYARESEANRRAWAVCRELGGVFEVSANMSMLMYAMEWLREESPEVWRECLTEMNQAVWHTFTAANGLNPFKDDLLRRISRQSAAFFLRLCGDPDGMNSYRSAVDAVIIPRS